MPAIPTPWPASADACARTRARPRAGAAPLLCNVHPEMSGYIVVSPTPYFAETDASGEFHIKDVPDGSYTVVAWHEGAKTQSKPVTVKGDTTQDFTLTK